MKEAVVYVRISTTKNADTILKEQYVKCLKFALENNYSISKIFHDIGVLANDLNRNGLQELLKYCADTNNKIDVVIVKSIDRLVNNKDDYKNTIEPVLKKRNIKLVSMSEELI